MYSYQWFFVSARHYIITNILLFSCMSIRYLHLIYSIVKRETAINCNKSVYVYKQVAVRLGLFFLTNFLTSMTVILLSVLSLSMYIPPSLEELIAFILFAFNSCINPLLYTVTSEFIKKTSVSHIANPYMSVLRYVHIGMQMVHDFIKTH